ncbi:MAG: hypothetical protein K0R15_142 [Clostridiales bacterium]|jgi:hypothetical protein|nr:hypothetical protein [Clostridiales bacterium]
MKTLKKLFNKPSHWVCGALISSAPILLLDGVCLIFWGEPECPDCLKQEIK